MHNADSVLLAYLHSTDDAERKRLEGELLQSFAAPLIRRTLRQRLGFYVDQSGRNPNYPDAADLFQDVQLCLLQKLSELHSQRNTNHIGNFGHYVVRVAINSCNEYLRHKTPERSSLNHNLRDLMSRHRDFGIWKGENNKLLCGFAVWKSQRTNAIQSIPAEKSDEIIEALQRAGLARQDIQRFPLTKIVSEIFNQIGHPIEINCLAETMAALLMIKDLPPESLDQNEEGDSRELVASGPAPDAQVEGREMLQQMWLELLRMPPIQRTVVCFKFSDHNGEDFFHLILTAKIATLDELTYAFGLTCEELIELGKQLPMDTAALADHLGIARPLVSKWHHRASKRLIERLMKK
ncbi:MAG: sigma-70 family RNA polymerase sigma factor [Acidobacteriota bacterium]